MTTTVTVRFQPDLRRQLDEVSRELGMTRSEFVRDALRRQLAVRRFNAIRASLMPFAEARGLLTDEDVLDGVS